MEVRRKPYQATMRGPAPGERPPRAPRRRRQQQVGQMLAQTTSRTSRATAEDWRLVVDGTAPSAASGSLRVRGPRSDCGACCSASPSRARLRAPSAWATVYGTATSFFLLSAAVLFGSRVTPWAIALGATFPSAVRWFEGGNARRGHGAGETYAANTHRCGDRALDPGFAFCRERQFRNDSRRRAGEQPLCCRCALGGVTSPGMLMCWLRGG